ncbi:CD225/dispanin family protein [Muribaculum sp.]|uniref:CD225/dispanin family protein n=1 Tax=Muribaculum sp. TaxID=1918611 RepID=UPI0023D4DB7E|nr:CD225/dispanin family protein [Muribaculum sp.]MDE5705561.1 CD225/dispanin family protein [Muribaculum sp.]
MKYYIIENEAPVGPFDVAELVARGLRPTDLVWAEGMADWAAAESVEEVRMALYGPKNNIEVSQPSATVQSGAFPPPAPHAPQPQPEYQQPQAAYQQQYQQPQYQQPQYQQPQYQQPQYQQPQYQQPQYQQQGQQPYQQPILPPDNYLAWAVVVTILCCVPFGIVAIIKAASVNGLWNTGNYDKAYEASASAKKWIIITVIVGIVSQLLYGGFMIFSGVMNSL